MDYAIRLHETHGTVGPAPAMRIHFRQTMGTRAALRKVYKSAIAEALVWEHHADRFADQVGRSAARRALLTWPGRRFAEVARTRRLSIRAAARDLVTRIGHVMAYRTLLKDGQVPDPILLKPEDDPLRQPAEAPATDIVEDQHDH